MGECFQIYTPDVAVEPATNRPSEDNVMWKRPAFSRILEFRASHTRASLSKARESGSGAEGNGGYIVDWGKWRSLGTENVTLSGMESVSMAVIVAPVVNPTSDTIIDFNPVQRAVIQLKAPSRRVSP